MPVIDSTEADRARFCAICRDLLTAKRNGSRGYGDDGEGDHVGLLAEKRMHAIIKRYICPDVSYHEQRVAESVPGAKKYVADILCGDEIYEIQTAGFYPLQKKLQWYADNTNYHVTVVHPLAVRRRIVRIDPESGVVIPSKRLSPSKKPISILPELVYISELIAAGRVGVRLLLIDAEEYRLAGVRPRHSRKNESRYEIMPTDLLGEIMLELPEDIAELLPATLPDTFTGTDLAECLRMPSRRAYMALHALENLGVIVCIDDGRPKKYTLSGKRSAHV